MSICTSAKYASPSEARGVSRGLRRRWHLSVAVTQCETCDHYHLKCNASRLTVPKKALEVVRLTAMGFSTIEVSKIMEIPLRTSRWYIEELRETFGALSTAHLVSIFSALGLLNPTDFVPSLTERDHAGE